MSKYTDMMVAHARQNIAKWGEQDDATLCIALMEEAGEVAQACLQWRHEGGDIGRIEAEALDAGALCFQIMRSFDGSQIGETIDHNSLQYLVLALGAIVGGVIAAYAEATNLLESCRVCGQVCATIMDAVEYEQGKNGENPPAPFTKGD